MTIAQLDVAIDRPLPQAPEAERAVLGSILINNEAWWRVANLTTDDFFKEAHRTIYKAMARLMPPNGDGIDGLNIVEELRRTGEIDHVGGVAYVAALLDGIPDVAKVERYANIVKRKAAQRRLIVLGNKLMRAGLQGLDEPEEIAAAAMSELSPHVTTQKRQSRELLEVTSDSFDRLQNDAVRQKSNAKKCGIFELDQARCFRSTFVVIGMPSRHGKTGFCVTLADGFAKNGHKVLFYTLESTEEEVALRWASMTAGVAHSRTQDWSRLLDRPEDRSRLQEARKAAGERPIRLVRAIRTVEGMYAECRRLKALHGLDAVLVDYIQLVRTEERIGNLEERFAHISQLFLEYAIDLDVTWIAASQLNKDWRSRPIQKIIDDPKNPETIGYDIDQEDLKRCAAIGETARVGIFGYRPGLLGLRQDVFGQDLVIDGKNLNCSVDLHIAKNNENVTNRYPFHFDEVTQQFKGGRCLNNRCSARVGGPTSPKLFA